MKGSTRLAIRMLLTIIAIIVVAALIIWLSKSFFGPAMKSGGIGEVFG